ncbi:cation:H+ antiporter [Marinilabilia salmonicolor]|jgi:cation:H+ antiporter|uniref:calcium/sodium antiporter n=1 Tax=Marinilabilia salmonicolor TaxID=989 RepID=UPI000D04CA74|nr:calcium/sodium antiporter [Marinilabilia salmonicolor]PRZ00562.1 cation:H+ antiporter [Marinilabilia salmonicolor]
MDVNSYLLVLVGFVLLFLCGNWLVRGGVELSRHFHVSPLVAGLTVVAFGTSAPELFVSVKAVFTESPDISIGNVVGSNIANIGLILGAVAIIFPLAVRKPSILNDWLVMILSYALLFLFLINEVLEFYEGLIFVFLIAGYIVLSVWSSRKHSAKSVEVFPDPTMKILPAVGFVIVAVLGLYFGADWLVKGASDLAIGWGVSERVVGISIVAFGTSVPELATSLAAALKKEMDISIGNIIGSNIFNVFSILGVTAILKPLQVSPRVISSDMIWMTVVAVLLLLFMLPLRNGVISRWKGALLLLFYIVYIWVLFVS